MKALTLTDYIKDKQYTDNEFAEYYTRERLTNNIAELILKLREKNGLSQLELASKVSLKQTMITRVEEGQGHLHPSLETLIRIAAVFNMNIELKLC